MATRGSEIVVSPLRIGMDVVLFEGVAVARGEPILVAELRRGILTSHFCSDRPDLDNRALGQDIHRHGHERGVHSAWKEIVFIVVGDRGSFAASTLALRPLLTARSGLFVSWPTNQTGKISPPPAQVCGNFCTNVPM
mmetsp:Transcript_23042/g.34661  ORF Transcript_23042/g.34661 Transcript_23042/m.34661 type:complete len:137 (+) Transcript_23042:366-776(+)